MSESIPVEQLSRGCLIEIEIDGKGRSKALVQAVRLTESEVEIDIFSRKTIPTPSKIEVNYWMISAPYGTPVRASHLPTESGGDKRAAHAGRHQQRRNSEPAEAG